MNEFWNNKKRIVLITTTAVVVVVAGDWQLKAVLDSGQIITSTITIR